jgi:nucleotide-binding universal stress UspA family protein
MATILCSTRGGQASYPNQDRAIAIAREREADLLFLYVSNVRFLNLVASPVLIDLEEELDEMGEFMLAMAQERAEKAGVQASAEVRRGVFRQALKASIKAHHITTVVLGSSTEGEGVTTLSYLQELVEWVRTETGAEVIVVSNGEIVNVTKL